MRNRNENITERKIFTADSQIFFSRKWGVRRKSGDKSIRLSPFDFSPFFPEGAIAALCASIQKRLDSKQLKEY
jgi:hypothetical protein